MTPTRRRSLVLGLGLGLTLVLGLGFASPAAANPNLTQVDAGGGSWTIAYKNNPAVATYRTEARAGADWFIIDVYYPSALTEATVKVGRGTMADGSAVYVVTSAGLTRTGASTTATGSRNLDGQHFHFEIPVAEGAAFGDPSQGGPTFTFTTGVGTSSFTHVVPPAPPAPSTTSGTVPKTKLDRCEAELMSLRKTYDALVAKAGSTSTKKPR